MHSSHVGYVGYVSIYRAIYQYVTPIIKMWDCKLKHVWQTDDTYNKEFVLFPFLFFNLDNLQILHKTTNNKHSTGQCE